jgi:hypothetical protein
MSSIILQVIQLTAAGQNHTPDDSNPWKWCAGISRLPVTHLKTKIKIYKNMTACFSMWAFLFPSRIYDIRSLRIFDEGAMGTIWT